MNYSQIKQHLIFQQQENIDITICHQQHWIINYLLTYFIPVLILSLPILAGQVPDFIDFFQALTVFLSLVYLKMLYWQRIF